MNALVRFVGIVRAALDELDREAAAAVATARPLPSSSKGSEPPRAQVGRMVEVASAPGVIVVPLVRALEPSSDGPPAFMHLPAVELSRVPCAGEWLLAGGETLRVLSVRHVPGGDIAAELQCERLPALQPKGEDSVTVFDLLERRT